MWFWGLFNFNETKNPRHELKWKDMTISRNFLLKVGPLYKLPRLLITHFWLPAHFMYYPLHILITFHYFSLLVWSFWCFPLITWQLHDSCCLPFFFYNPSEHRYFRHVQRNLERVAHLDPTQADQKRMHHGTVVHGKLVVFVCSEYDMTWTDGLQFLHVPAFLCWCKFIEYVCVPSVFVVL